MVVVAVAVAVAEKNTKTHGKNGKMKVATFFCHQVGQIWSYRALVFSPKSSPRDIAIDKGVRVTFLNIEGIVFGFHVFVVVTQRNKN